ncbi:hypothetical protein AK88_02988 [Plasmodium fragile]|uniref:Schizont-infected cell agglutination extracellular alpha domain-containing protein n=1 Tax=Plasmodium fragile TaxID=5857 RepID=A0A0D9QK23_PLAFR|nr:uncharacterized protein AK88_02988 [Plasmodium fragile]KJP87308.1 hypothetical protein AK88_02988 [Plasmodium fragile]
MHHDGHQAGEIFNETDKAVCWLVLKALSFKHGIQWMAGGTHLNNVHTEDATIEPYMKCILVNIFMKKIIGHKCLHLDGGRNAFKAATATRRQGQYQEPNMECEKEDRKDGTKTKGQNTAEWDPWDIMKRWLQRNKRYLSDGDWGVLGKECIVDRDNGAVGTNEEQVIEIKHRANNKIEEVGTALEAVVKEILKEIDSSSAGESMDSIIKKVKQGKDSASTTPQQHGQSAGEQQATSSSTTTSSPGMSEPGTTHTAVGSAKPADNEPATQKEPTGKDTWEKARMRTNMTEYVPYEYGCRHNNNAHAAEAAQQQTSLTLIGHDRRDERTVGSVGHCVDERTVQRRGDECGAYGIYGYKRIICA